MEKCHSTVIWLLIMEKSTPKRSIDKFKLCSDGCDDNKQKMVELANVGHWETICQLLFVSPKSLSGAQMCRF
jgi:hypothetical protein